MSDSLVVLLMVLVGVQFAAQAPVNGGLGRHTGGLVAALISFLVGNVALLAIVAVAGQLGNFSSLGEVPLWQLAGGLIGATYVALAATTISRIGAGVIAAVTVTGQLACSVVVDHFGWFGIEVHDVTGPRILGLVLLLAGAMAMLYSREEAGGGGASRAGRQTGHGIGSMASGAENRERLVICAVIFLASLAVGIQHPLNSELANSIGDLPAGLTNFTVGTILLALLVIVTGQAKALLGAREARPQYFLGGLIGLIVVVTSLSAVTLIGAAGLTAALVTGQMIGSLLLDRFGAFGLTRIPIDRVRLAAAAALLIGTFLATG
ncbi:MAG TPA: DMT family transporter [Solirubrobacterales bacterium]|nr:DMT family transporter [Solirubrobacterales bacterium]HMU27706.1 DMT family transporter [Solirubrobacterales bacterium]HMX70729.1 DMT family transporter [Solirubrobacterales bacterium]HMY25789.1 DMT family transporter [Solirubrobacterales bacterium]HNA24523.1 DMT family transporter [Solirubrobacterales bacterium]